MLRGENSEIKQAVTDQEWVRSNGGGDEDRGRERDRYNEAIVISGEVEFATLFASNLPWKVNRIWCMVMVLVLRHYMRILDWDCVQGHVYCDCHRIHLESCPSISRLSVCTFKSVTFVGNRNEHIAPPSVLK